MIPICSLLKLSGVTRAEERRPLTRTPIRLTHATRGYPTHTPRLRVRNRIYERVFDRHWVRANMPDAELRRQRAAYLKGVLRTAALSAATLAVVAGLGISERMQARRADRLAEQKQKALTESSHLLYGADMNLVAQPREASWPSGTPGRGA